MRLGTLVKVLDEKLDMSNAQNTVISGIHFHSQKVEPGFVFVAIRGFSEDGNQYVQEAIASGAVAIIGEDKLEHINGIPYISVPDSRLALSRLSAAFYQFPARKHKVIGITGTNGKTTTAFMLHHLLTYAKKTVTLVSSVYHIINGEQRQSTATTPDARTIQKILAESQDEFVIIEVSSHGLDQKRVEDVVFDLAIFTNLSHDHLNYHQNMEEYFLSKRHLFQLLKENGQAIIATYSQNFGERMANEVRKQGVMVTTIGANSSNDVYSTYSTEFSTLFELNKKENPNDSLMLKLPIKGVYQSRNALIAYITAEKCGLEAPIIQAAFSSFQGVPGRFQMTHLKNGAHVVIDYAHSPDAIQACLQTVASYQPHSIYHIFGFRGDSDASKRKVMVDNSITYSDYTILTLDDLNGVSMTEMESVLRYYQKVANVQVRIILDRTMAIETVFNQLQKDDWLVITGKGHETYKQKFERPVTDDQGMINHLIDYSK
ncbi:UDP-N-acetylmuramoyl-L-alanyl-D-glutamate--2,6-diaminopimelate ligase [Alkalihalobacillus pseudalcaliphilus]|uniref:UDP-N-acetylmuramoyl-L-alanyl-D-glutamate--2, 6-diaminopimelate ligase n=1 Tax=Alkalihalobacillus pseudalcaliphilus TaxID=79884 RepID=UPI00064D87A6|nr:UDP-N-acetylmuramoyl-L-alanyl-D-glutamate--2,6-diaminopimelate ligase [Alkalihalobacillus pseudalcaliphilus]KMK76180.1 hypothetical protein AB990_13250 [Alkalihalobacillus pseudalcaliphilus]